MLKWSMFAMLAGFFLDLCFGDPYWMPHCIRLMGKCIVFLEKLFRKLKNEYLGGFFLVLTMLALFGVVPVWVLWRVYQENVWVGLVVETFLSYQMLAAKSLRVESMKVYTHLKQNDVEGARTAVSMIVGRDTKTLTGEGIMKAAVETVAENTSDGEIAPLFYMAIGGAGLAMAYKAINTMDSMIGYHNELYEKFGFCAAKTDDIVNFIPARIAAFLMILSAAFFHMDVKNAWRIFLRDRYQHKSPNSAQTESVCAGALNIQLAGNAYYFGKLVEKPWIGDPVRKIEQEDIIRANRLLYGSSVLMVILSMVVKCILLLF